MKIADKNLNMVLNSSQLTNTTAIHKQNQSTLFDKSVEKVSNKAYCPQLRKTHTAANLTTTKKIKNQNEDKETSLLHLQF